jgi:glycosyltransferase involved in cell wall biosynthesis
LKTETKSQSTDVSSQTSGSLDKVGTEGIGEARSDALFSLIVCTRGRTEELKRFLLSVRDQIGDIRCEIIVVDQNTDGRLDSILEAYSDRIEIQHIRSPVGLYRGRNFGLRQVRGSVVAFPDDDCVYPAKLLNDVHARLASLQTADGISVMSRDFKGKASGPRWSLEGRLDNQK